MPQPDAKDVQANPLDRPELLEELSAIEHERWSHWQQYLHSKCAPGPDGSLIIPSELVERWGKQMSTPYHLLPDDQRASDREQVQRYLPLIKKTLQDLK